MRQRVLLRGEGNKNVAVRVQTDNFSLDNAPLSMTNTSILRLAKEKTDDASIELQTAFYSLVTATLLGPQYSANSNLVHLEPALIASIASEIEPQRSPTRTHKSIDIHQSKVLVTEDHTLFDNNTSECGDVYSVELKPKWGFMPLRYQVLPYPQCRFCLHSHLKAQKALEKSPLFVPHPHFCPLDLYSNEYTRISKALEALIRNPGNNLRVCINGESINEFESVKESFRNSTRESDSIWDLVARILIQEPLFQILAGHQERLDGGGVDRVFASLQEGHKTGLSVQQPKTIQEWETVLNQYLELTESVDSTEKDVRQTVLEYLISTSLKDLSLILTFRIIPNDALIDSRHQQIQWNNHNVEYKLRVIDVDIKSVEKMEYYFNQDKEIMSIGTDFNYNYCSYRNM